MIDWTRVLFFIFSMCRFNRCNDFITIYLLDSCMTMYECVFSIHVKIIMKTIKKILKNVKSK